jgi:hypothetical protein
MIGFRWECVEEGAGVRGPLSSSGEVSLSAVLGLCEPVVFLLEEYKEGVEGTEGSESEILEAAK